MKRIVAIISILGLVIIALSVSAALVNPSKMDVIKISRPSINIFCNSTPSCGSNYVLSTQSCSQFGISMFPNCYICSISPAIKSQISCPSPYNYVDEPSSDSASANYYLNRFMCYCRTGSCPLPTQIQQPCPVGFTFIPPDSYYDPNSYFCLFPGFTTLSRNTLTVTEQI